MKQLKGNPIYSTSNNSNDPPSRGFLAVAPFFMSSFAWNFTLGMTFMLIPLYARSLGMSGLQIGILFALPVVLQFFISLLGGAFTDRIGGKNMAMLACIMAVLSGLTFMASSGFALMFLAQLMMVTSRGMFWPATWSLAGQLSGRSAKQMGRLTSATNGGHISGTIAGGFIIAEAGFITGFAVMAAAGLVALILNQMFRNAPAAPRNPAGPIFATYRMLLKKRTIRYGIMCSYLSALPISLCFSFYPILLVEQGFSSDAAGTLLSLRSVGAIISGFIVGSFIKRVDGLGTPLVASVVVGLSVALGAAVSHTVLLAILLFGLGVGSAMMTVYFQMLIKQSSTRETSGSAQALGSLGFSVSNLSTPLIMGVLKDYVGIHTAFYVIGGFAVLCGLTLIPLQRWAFAAEPAAAGDPV
jgi:MFS family permease